MSPLKTHDRPAAAVRQVDRVAALLGVRVHDERARRSWTLARVAERAGLSIASVHAAESGRHMSFETYAALAVALDLRLDVDLVDPLHRVHPTKYQDLVHSAMGEMEAARLRSLGFTVALDEPYQHYQFAGRADFLAWDLHRRALMHVENRTRFPDVQAAAGSWNAKRSYLVDVLAKRLGVVRWATVTHAMACLWSSEVLHVLRIRSETFRSLCPDPPIAFDRWWTGEIPYAGVSSTLVVLDPQASRRQHTYIGLETALQGARPRYRGYAEAADQLRAGGRTA